MVRVTGQQLQKASFRVRSAARREPVEDYTLLRQNRKIALTPDTMSAPKLQRIANNRMDDAHAHLNALMDD